jgi:predicted RNase H-like HicB family nuclease
MRLKIKMIYDFDEDQYVVFVEGIVGLEGVGKSEQEAIENFNTVYDRAMRDSTL